MRCKLISFFPTFPPFFECQNRPKIYNLHYISKGKVDLVVDLHHKINNHCTLNFNHKHLFYKDVINYYPVLPKRRHLKPLIAVRVSVQSCVRPRVPGQISEMAQWINMNFKYVIPCYVRMMQVILDFQNSQRWPTGGHFPNYGKCLMTP